ncbi:hypothetical protein GQ53DRAFT_858115 [Thozetella sp. PMI_491]|nr:hypothetical protein GQ53DRAFT_858115 [Thozetella sp. PMI_491]
MSLCLGLGSPILAAYSLSLAVLSTRRINEDFGKEYEAWHESCPHKAIVRDAKVILIESQHCPFRVRKGPNHDFAQMIVQPENSTFWAQLRSQILVTKRPPTLSLYFQLGGALAAFILSIVQFFTTKADDNAIVVGLAISTLWCWMIPVIWGWVSVGSQTSAYSIGDAIRAVPVPCVVDAEKSPVTRCEALTARPDDFREPQVDSFAGFTIAGWDSEPGPMFAYARVWTHLVAAHHIKEALAVLRNKQAERLPVETTSSWNYGEWRANLKGSPEMMAKYLFGDTPGSEFSVHSDNPPGIWRDFVSATLIAFLIQWGTTGPSVLMLYETPPIGLGCESGSYLLYGGTATLVWILLSLSAWLTHLWAVRRENGSATPSKLFSLGSFAIFTRLLGNTLAVLNAAWLIILSFFQFTNMYNNCWCGSSAFQWGYDFWVLLFPTDAEVFSIGKNYWIAGTFVGVFCCSVAGAFFVMAKGNELFRDGDVTRLPVPSIDPELGEAPRNTSSDIIKGGAGTH